MIYYFAYGSNLHPVRLTERVPSAELIGVARHPDHALTFHKRSHDGSSKCNMHYTGSGCVYGAIYRLDPDHKNELDKFEGKGFGYIDIQIAIECNGSQYACFTYIAQESHIVGRLKPYDWYKRLVILGAQYLKLSESYVASIESVESIDDPDSVRKQTNEGLIQRIKNCHRLPALDT